MIRMSARVCWAVLGVAVLLPLESESCPGLRRLRAAAASDPLPPPPPGHPPVASTAQTGYGNLSRASNRSGAAGFGPVLVHSCADLALTDRGSIVL